MNKATSMREQISYAQCFIEITTNRKPPTTISFQIEDGELVDITLEYEWLPPCRKCSSFGPIYSQCPSIPSIQT